MSDTPVQFPVDLFALCFHHPFPGQRESVQSAKIERHLTTAALTLNSGTICYESKGKYCQYIQ
ncbi:Uncharacterised protein [Enterobacter cloacae]|nr:Uncharacterised protein [Enterobacter cloacae]